MNNTVLHCQLVEREPVLDHCGVVGAFFPKDVAFFDTGLLGLKRLQTRGYDGAGFFALTSRGKCYQHKDKGMVKEVFSPRVIDKFKTTSASVWIYQTRYGTSGGFVKKNVQPLIAEHKVTGEMFCVAHNGQFVENGLANDWASDTVRFVNQLAHSRATTWDERIIETILQKEGAWGLIIGTKTAMYLARDDRGVRPLYYGQCLNGFGQFPFWLAASETSALQEMGVNKYWEVMPGSVIKIEKGGLRPLARSVYNRELAVCIFEDVYISDGDGKALLPRRNPLDIKNSFTVDEVRYRCGAIFSSRSATKTG